MKIYVAQVKPIIGGLQENFNLIENHYNKAIETNCDICVFPEMVTTGYHPKDLLLKGFIEELQNFLQLLVPKIGNTTLILPTPLLSLIGLENGLLIIQNGKIIGQTAKSHLPNYKIFDEARYFRSGKPNVFTINNVKIGVPICEDIWFSNVLTELKNAGAELIIVVNASPFEEDKFNTRLKLVGQRYNEVKLPIIYCNQVLAQDGIIYDGRSFAYDGQLKQVLKAFTDDVMIIEYNNDHFLTTHDTPNFSEEELLYAAMVFGVREYVVNNGFSKVLIGLSGGIDSALTAAIATDAFGPENVETIMLPSKFTSKESLEDASEVAQLLGVKYSTIPIQNMVDAVSNTLSDISSLAYENLQARIRGVLLMTLSNTNNNLLLTTGNKSEVAVGYATLYGDMCGAFNPIKDLYKTAVFKMAKYRNTISKVFPDRVITKPPSAELRVNQKDTDALPEYELLDRILQLYIEEDLEFQQIIALGYEENIVRKVIKLIKNAEYKRHQSAPGVKLTSKAFGHDRKYPLTNGYSE